MKQCEKQRGSLTLETAIVLPIFFLLILFVYSLFGIYSAHNQMSHALVQASKSLAMDPYLYEETELAGETTTKFWGGLDDVGLNVFRMDNDPYFMALTDWYNKLESSEYVIRNRFIGYLTGGDEQAAEEKLNGLRIVNGLNGVDFDAQIVGDDQLQITMKYTIKMLFNFWDYGEMPVEQTVQVKLWK